MTMLGTIFWQDPTSFTNLARLPPDLKGTCYLFLSQPVNTRCKHGYRHIKSGKRTKVCCVRRTPALPLRDKRALNDGFSRLQLFQTGTIHLRVKDLIVELEGSEETATEEQLEPSLVRRPPPQLPSTFSPLLMRPFKLSSSR